MNLSGKNLDIKYEEIKKELQKKQWLEYLNQFMRILIKN